MSAMDSRGLDLMTEMNKLAIALATLILAAVGKLVASQGNKTSKTIDLSSSVTRILCGAVVVFAMATLYLSYLVYDKLVEMLAAGFLDLNSELILKPRNLQIDCLLASFFVLGLTIVIAIGNEK